MTLNKGVLSGCRLIPERHVTIDLKAVVLLSVNSRPDASVATPNDISETYQVILGREDSINLVTLFNLVIIELLEIFAHSHGADRVARIKTIQGVTSGVGR